jgi:hypothetical protein
MSYHAVNSATVDGMLDHHWRNLQDDNSEAANAFARGVIEATRYLGLITDVEAEGWVARMNHCPDLEDGHAGRAWCAFCGSIATDGQPRE